MIEQIQEVEVVARAILSEASREGPDLPVHWTFWADEARAAILALDEYRVEDEPGVHRHGDGNLWRHCPHCHTAQLVTVVPHS